MPLALILTLVEARLKEVVEEERHRWKEIADRKYQADIDAWQAAKSRLPKRALPDQNKAAPEPRGGAEPGPKSAPPMKPARPQPKPTAQEVQLAGREVSKPKGYLYGKARQAPESAEGREKRKKAEVTCNYVFVRVRVRARACR